MKFGKKIKKLAVLMMSAVMVMALAMPGFAATTSASDKGSITIHGLEAGVTASAYQIAEATYDSDGNFLGYEMTVSGGSWSINPDGSWSDPSEADLAALYENVGSAAGTAAANTAEDDGFSATISGLSVGSYLIVITGSESVVYGMMIGSVSYDVDANGEWMIDNGEFSVSDSELWAKATTPVLTKTEHHTDGEETHGESANTGDEVTFDITVSPIPSYQGEHPTFEVDDVLTGLHITDAELASLKVTAGSATLTEEVDYTVTKVSDSEFIVDFVVNGAYTLNAYAGGTLVIEYQAIVDDSDAYENGELEHDNDATLTYSTTSYALGNEGKSEDHDYEYSFNMRAEKTDGTNALAGATFGLFTDASCSTAYTQDGTAVTAVSSADGIISFSGLAEGTYYMTELEAPAGYLLNQAVYTVEIEAYYNTSGQITYWTLTVKDANGNEITSVTNSATSGLSIANTKTGLLPSMGGRGTLTITLIGCAVVVCAAVGVVASRRRRAA